MQRVWQRLVADTLLVGALLFLAAGRVDWWRAWVLLAVMLTVRVLTALRVERVSPDLLRDRAKLPLHAAQSAADRVLLLGVLATGFLGLPLLAGLDVFRWHVMPSPSTTLSAAGLVSFTVGWALKGWALYHNAFAVAAVRHQVERAHRVVTAGPYRVIRHPFYAADPLIHVGLCLWLQSTAALCASVVPTVLVMMRLVLEERFLTRTLDGYAAYVRQVRFRLVPGIW
jgi:protein-S-isoprenylcysteine O-methyltransferase Ste14